MATVSRTRLAGALLLIAGLSAGCAPAAGSSPTPSTGPATAIIRVGASPGVPVAAYGFVWVPNTGDGTLSKIDPRTNRVVDTIRVGDAARFYRQHCQANGSVHSFMVNTFHVRDCDMPSAVAAGAGAIWILKNDEQSVLRLDPSSDRVTARIALNSEPYAIAADDSWVWVTSLYGDLVTQIDPQTNRVAGRLRVTGEPSELAVGDGALWVALSKAAELARIDPATTRLTGLVPLPCPSNCLIGSVPVPVATSPGAVWVRGEQAGLIYRIDPATDRVIARIPAPVTVGRAGLDAMGVINGQLWVSAISLAEIDPASNRTVRTLPVIATTVSTGYGSLWITDAFGQVERINPGR